MQTNRDNEVQQTQAKINEQLSEHILKLNPNEQPPSVAGKNKDGSPKLVNNWDKRVQLAKNFFDTNEHNNNNIKVIKHQNKPVKPKPKNPGGNWIYDVTTCPKILIKRLENVDGAVIAKQEGQKAQNNPVMIIAANAEHIGGSPYRVGGKGTGDAQEEQAGNTYAGALALATHPGVARGIEHGDILYSDEYKSILMNRGAIEVNNVPSIDDGQRCDQILLAAPNLKPKNECFNNGQFDHQKYQDDIYTMYTNLFTAITNKKHEQPIILTLPGAGVFLGNDESVKKQAIIIQGLCLRRVLNEQADKIQKHQFSLPWGKEKIASEILDIAFADEFALTNKIEELKSLQMDKISKSIEAIQNILGEIDKKADALNLEGEDKKDDVLAIKNFTVKIRNNLTLSNVANNQIDSSPMLNDFRKVMDKAAKHGGIKQDLMHLLAAILDVFSLSLTAWLIPNAKFKVGIQGNLLELKEKFNSFKADLNDLKPAKDDEAPPQNLGSP